MTLWLWQQMSKIKLEHLVTNGKNVSTEKEENIKGLRSQLESLLLVSLGGLSTTLSNAANIFNYIKNKNSLYFWLWTFSLMAQPFLQSTETVDLCLWKLTDSGQTARVSTWYQPRPSACGLQSQRLVFVAPLWMS